MELVNVRDLFRRQDEYVDQTIAIGGWVRNIRNSKNFGFIVVNDGTFFEPVQVVYSDVLENFEEVEKLNVGAAIIVTGKLVATPGTKQPFEIQAEKVEVEGPSTPDYPLQKKKHSFEYLRTISHLRPRTNTFEAVFRVRSLCAYAIHKFFQERDFVYVHTPLITGSDCEGAGEMFQVTTLDMNNLPMTEDGKVDYSKDFFNKPTNLTVSGQLNGETYAMAFKNIYTFGPTFRAENSNTTRHAAELDYAYTTVYSVRVVDYNTNSAIVTLKGVVPVDIETIGLNIRKCRNAKKMRQEDLAQKANVSSNYISAVERGVKIPSVETLIDIMNALGVSADMIFCDVIDAGVTEKNNQLDAKVSQLSTKDRKTVYDVLDLLVRGLSK